MEETPSRPRRARSSPFVEASEAAPAFAAEAPQAEVQEASPRREMRPAMREEDPRVRAARRAAEIRNNLGNMDEGPDKFFIDQSSVPAGWSYEWKRKAVLGQEDPSYMVQLERMGWEPVPASRHPSYMPDGGRYSTIERDGMILMERPLELTEESRSIELKRARNQVRQKEAQLNSAPDGQFGRDNKGNSLAKVSKSYESIPIPEE